MNARDPEWRVAAILFSIAVFAAVMLLGRVAVIAMSFAFWLAVLVLPLALTPARAWRSLATILVVAVLWPATILAAGLFANCDVNMRPFIAQLVFLFGPLAITANPVLTVGVVAVCVLFAPLAVGLSRTLHGTASRRALIGVACATPIVFVFATALFGRAGAHPVPGNCVL